MAEAERGYAMNVLDKILEEIERLEDPYYKDYVVIMLMYVCSIPTSMRVFIMNEC